ncbi:MAG: hypothetical protein M3510_13000 [Actinomycetota bacterium]|nr:hypothetical protein [Actinomycetota bacterium]
MTARPPLSHFPAFAQMRNLGGRSLDEMGNLGAKREEGYNRGSNGAVWRGTTVRAA